MDKLVKVWTVGRMSYMEAFRLQQYLASSHHKNLKKEQNTLILVEHNPVYTIGIRSKDYTDNDEIRLKALGAEFHRTDRGGLITFHGPGQLVAYPVINLKKFTPSVRWYVSQIEKTVIDLCKTYNITAKTTDNTGVWVGDNKICAIGLRCSRYVTTHGLALNCNVDFDWYEHIVPCGIEGKGITSISKELNRNVTIDEVSPLFIESFCKIFKCFCCNKPQNEIDEVLMHLGKDNDDKRIKT